MCQGRPVLVLKFALAFPRQIKDTSEVVLFWVAVSILFWKNLTAYVPN